MSSRCCAASASRAASCAARCGSRPSRSASRRPPRASPSAAVRGLGLVALVQPSGSPTWARRRSTRAGSEARSRSACWSRWPPPGCRPAPSPRCPRSPPCARHRARRPVAAGRWRLALAVLCAGRRLLAAGLAVSRSLPGLAVMLAAAWSTFVGVLLLGPLARPGPGDRRPAGSLGSGPVRRLAAGNAVRNPRRTATTAASLLVGVTLTAAVLTGLASSRTGLDETMDPTTRSTPRVTAVDAPLDGRPRRPRRRRLEGVDGVLTCSTAPSPRSGAAGSPLAAVAGRPPTWCADRPTSRPATARPAVLRRGRVAGRPGRRPGAARPASSPSSSAGRDTSSTSCSGRSGAPPASSRPPPSRARLPTRARSRCGCGPPRAPMQRTSTATSPRWPAQPGAVGGGYGDQRLGRPAGRHHDRRRGRAARDRGRSSP